MVWYFKETITRKTYRVVDFFLDLYLFKRGRLLGCVVMVTAVVVGRGSAGFVELAIGNSSEL